MDTAHHVIEEEVKHLNIFYLSFYLSLNSQLSYTLTTY